MGSAILSRYKIPSAAERALLDAPYTVAEPWRLFSWLSSYPLLLAQPHRRALQTVLAGYGQDVSGYSIKGVCLDPSSFGRFASVISWSARKAARR